MTRIAKRETNETNRARDRNQTNKSEEKVLYKELSYEIMNAAFKVHNALGPGFTEKIYEEALCIELRNKKLKYERQKTIDVSYDGVKVGEYFLDVLVEGKVLLELKATSEHHPLFEAQVHSYLKATGLRLGLLMNFGTLRLTHKRIIH